MVYRNVMRERWRRKTLPQRPVAPKPVTPRALEAGVIGYREIRTFLDPGTQVSGKLNFSTPTRIEGRLRGEVRSSDRLEVAVGGSVHGTVWPKTLVVAGEVRGQILGAERVEVQPGGRIVGHIETRVLVVPPGATVEADLRVGVEPEVDAAVSHTRSR
jgi:cytoskeletal protein CcmA (bactofilin family)